MKKEGANGKLIDLNPTGDIVAPICQWGLTAFGQIAVSLSNTTVVGESMSDSILSYLEGVFNNSESLKKEQLGLLTGLHQVYMYFEEKKKLCATKQKTKKIRF